MQRAAGRAGPTAVVVPQRNASQSLKPWSNTRPGSAALFGRTWPAPWRDDRHRAVGVGRNAGRADGIVVAEVMSADLIIIGVQLGWQIHQQRGRDRRRAGSTSTCRCIWLKSSVAERRRVRRQDVLARRDEVGLEAGRRRLRGARPRDENARRERRRRVEDDLPPRCTVAVAPRSRRTP